MKKIIINPSHNLSLFTLSVAQNCSQGDLSIYIFYLVLFVVLVFVLLLAENTQPPTRHLSPLLNTGSVENVGQNLLLSQNWTNLMSFCSGTSRVLQSLSSAPREFPCYKEQMNPASLKTEFQWKA